MNTSIITTFGGFCFVGLHIAAAARAKGWIVRIATRDADTVKSVTGFVGQNQYVSVNYNDETSIRAVLRGSDYVVYSIGLLFEKKGRTFQKAHVDYPAVIARLAREEKATSFTLISALGCNNGTSNYAQTKLAGEKAVRAAFPQASILRPSLIFGQDAGFFVQFAGLVRLLPALPLIGGGKTKFQPVYVNDVAEAAILCLENKNTHGKTYELGGTETYSFKQLFELILHATRRWRPLVYLPFWLAKIEGIVFSVLPVPLITPDQVESLKTDNVVAQSALTLKDLGIQATGCKDVVTRSLQRFARKDVAA